MSKVNVKKEIAWNDRTIIAKSCLPFIYDYHYQLKLIFDL